MSRTRSIKLRRYRKGSRSLELDITPLLDVMILVLIYLAYAHYSSHQVASVPKVIDLPVSASKKPSSAGINVHVSKTQIWVENEEVVNAEAIKEAQLFDDDGRRIVPLYNRLVQIREMIQENSKLSPKVKKFSGVVNLVIDKSLKYNYLKRIIYTCGMAGYREFKFVVASK